MSTLLSLKNLLRVASSMALLALICTPVHGQWTKVPASAIPRGPDGKPNLAAPAPRLSDGRPDLSGIWASNGGDNQKPAKNPKTPGVPHQPRGQAPAGGSATRVAQREEPRGKYPPPGG